MKFELHWGTGNETCTNCLEFIKSNNPFLQQEQNRWGKGRLCQDCVKEFLENMERMKAGKEIKVKEIPNKITLSNSAMMKNSQYGGWD